MSIGTKMLLFVNELDSLQSIFTFVLLVAEAGKSDVLHRSRAQARRAPQPIIFCQSTASFAVCALTKVLVGDTQSWTELTLRCMKPRPPPKASRRKETYSEETRRASSHVFLTVCAIGTSEGRRRGARPGTPS